MPSEKFELPLRIVFASPLQGVAIAMQRGAADLAPGRPSPGGLVFDFHVVVTADANGAPRLLGPFVQGPTQGRFVYINSGAYAGETQSPWGRRAKVPLSGIGWDLIDAVRSGGRLAAEVKGTAKDGGPAAASVPLLPPGWRVAAD